MVRLEWRGGVFEDFESVDHARQAALVIFPRSCSQDWQTTDDGNYRCLSFWDEGRKKEGQPLARILIPLS